MNNTKPLLFTQNPVKSFKQFKEGLGKLPEREYIKAKITGNMWAVIGLIIGGTSTAYYGNWYFTIFIIALCYMQGKEYIYSKQRYKALLEFEKRLKEFEVKEATENV